MDRGAKRDSSAVKEYVIATGVGTLYGATNTFVGHPFDTVKTKMQAQAGGAGSFYRGASMRSTIAKLWSTEGIRGFYRGCLPPLWGSAVYRSAQFAVFDLLHSSMADMPALCQPIVGGMEARVPLAGVVGATARTVMESPIEYAKVRGQTGQSWRLRDVYRGAGLQWARTGPMMTFYFCMFDACQRAGLTATPIGQARRPSPHPPSRPAHAIATAVLLLRRLCAARVLDRLALRDSQKPDAGGDGRNRH